MTHPIRRATHADAPLVAGMLRAFNSEYGDPSLPADLLTRRIAELLAAGDNVVLLAGEPPCGFAVLRLRPSLYTLGRECYLAELYVAPPHRGRGIGRDLMLQAMDAARAEGADYMDLNTSETDTAARALYESLGFDNREGSPRGAVNYYYERML